MRGHNRCRSHRDKELGPRGAGAPVGNLNAFKSGKYADLPALPTLSKLAISIARDPEHLPEQIAQLTLDIQGRSGNPAKVLSILSRILPNLIPHIHESTFYIELERALPQYPGHFQANFLNALYKWALPMSPEDRVKFLRILVDKISKKQIPEE